MTKEELDRVAALAEDAAGFAIATGQAGLKAFQAEMAALGKTLPLAAGLDRPLDQAGIEERNRAYEAQLEAEFDNMPI